MLNQIVMKVNENNIESEILKLHGLHKKTFDKIVSLLEDDDKEKFRQMCAKLYRKGALDQVWGMGD